jgi:hypothetical protein
MVKHGYTASPSKVGCNGCLLYESFANSRRRIRTDGLLADAPVERPIPSSPHRVHAAFTQQTQPLVGVSARRRFRRPCARDGHVLTIAHGRHTIASRTRVTVTSDQRLMLCDSLGGIHERIRRVEYCGNLAGTV